MRQLLEAGVHFGHQTRRWNPRMAPYLFGARNGVHIIDLTQTVPMLHQALATSREVAASGGRVLFVGTKRQAQEPIARAAQRSGQYFVNHRWLGGMLTNWRTISQSIRRLRELEAKLAEGTVGLTKRETLQLTRERDKLERALGGIKDMGGLPDLLFVVDSNKESIAVAEARVLNIPVIAVVDSNSDPKDITFPVPGNDDASRAINLYCDLMVGAVLDGIQAEMAASGEDIGASESLPEAEVAPAEVAPVEEAAVPAEPEAEAPAAAEAAAEESPAVAAADTSADSDDDSEEADIKKSSAEAKAGEAEVAAAEEAESEPKKAAAAG
jgi:small subunit ribosomal protein S2